jgi:hypothetical protein
MATATLSKNRRGAAHDADPGSGWIRAYLASVRPLRGCADLPDSEEYQAGRSAIERLAISAHGQVSPTECADVVNFIRNSEPVKPRSWWNEPDDEPSHLVGLHVILEAVERSLRAKGGRP